MSIATLIAADNLSNGILSEAKDRLHGAGLLALSESWIDDHKAADILFDGPIDTAREALAPLEEQADIYVQDGAHRRKMLLVSDMDSTMITIECIDELADYAGIKPQIAEITERAMQGELDFAEALRARVALLKGLDEAVIESCLSERVKIMPGAEKLVQTMAAWGAHCLLVSGGFTRFTGPVGRQIGFHEDAANVLRLEAGVLTGEVEGDIVDAARKAALLEDRCQTKGLNLAQVLAVGDGANDIPMIEAAAQRGRLGAAYHAKPKAAAAANFAIRHNDLTALLYAQGVGRKDWA